jgi:hypothetical protein
MVAHITDALYRRLTPTERHRLAIDAYARADLDEVRRLSDTCPESRYWSQDPGYTERMKASIVIAFAAANLLFRASHAFQLAAAAKEMRGDLLEVLATQFSEAAADDVGRSEESAIVDRLYASRASEMVGVLEGIRRFCEEISVTPAKLLNLEPSCLPDWKLGSKLTEGHACEDANAETVY